MDPSQGQMREGEPPRKKNSLKAKNIERFPSMPERAQLVLKGPFQF